MSEKLSETAVQSIDFDTFRSEVLADYQLLCESREASLLGRKEVLTGKAKFGIFGDGKELAQIALAKQFKDGDFRSGYYRDQTWMMAIGALNVQQYFSGLYAHTDVTIEPQSAGRQMGGHFATRSLDENGEWKNLSAQKNSSADISPTAGQMPRLLGLAMASKMYRNNPGLQTDAFSKFSNLGNEVAFGSIGDASTSEGPFWETMNAAGVLQVPMVMSVWDDGYGISVPRSLQTTKNSISEALAGFQRTPEKPGFEIFTTKGWDYAHLCQTYEQAVAIARTEHVPVLIHVQDVNQPQGHSTSGSHERYKSEERMQWEKDFDCLAKFKEWILTFDGGPEALADENTLNEIQEKAKNAVKNAKNTAWNLLSKEIKDEAIVLNDLLSTLAQEQSLHETLQAEITALNNTKEPIRKDLFLLARKVIRQLRNTKSPAKLKLSQWLESQKQLNHDRYNSYLYSESAKKINNVPTVAPTYSNEIQMEDGRIILRENYRKLMEKHPEILVFGEDAGKIGGVNQSLEGLQDTFGELRVFDTGIRECTIIGQGIGMAMRGLRPIAEIQYLDYLLYAIQVLSDDLATVQYRTKGGQKAPLIISTRGHRLEGVWHSGSPMGMIINSLRGIHVCVPRNMTKAAGFYNTLMASDEPALVIEPLNGYRIKENIPTNLGEFTTALGEIEVLCEGSDLTMVSYGSTLNLCLQAIPSLLEMGISVELIDVQTLIPFDLKHGIAKSLSKTNRLMIVDEDVSAGASAFILEKIMVEQNGYYHLDAAPVTLSAKDHRPAYGTDGDYFSKPNLDDIIETAYALMTESDPSMFPKLFPHES
ncbi:MAG: transketolase [Flavobacteriia bacterium]|nr:transketolase [Flavobacteriia bacterium]NBV68511.1 transketolase [Flavobacteriia bacterium]NBV92348.1 transketolase [Flavobacteriia bacterium]NBY40301.1 transketolase [Flavobacteriia bacterium]